VSTAPAQPHVRKPSGNASRARFDPTGRRCRAIGVIATTDFPNAEQGVRDNHRHRVDDVRRGGARLGREGASLEGTVPRETSPRPTPERARPQNHTSGMTNPPTWRRPECSGALPRARSTHGADSAASGDRALPTALSRQNPRPGHGPTNRPPRCARDRAGGPSRRPTGGCRR
jgi:hypothetical protein